MKKEFLEIARKNDISPAVAEVFADKLTAEGYTLTAKPVKDTPSKLNVQPAKPVTPTTPAKK